MAATFVQSASGSNAGSGATTATLSVAPAVGNRLVAIIFWARFNANVLTPPPGFTLLGEYDNGDQAISVYYKTSVGAGDQAATASQAPTDSMGVLLGEYSGAGALSNFAGVTATTTPVITAPDAASIFIGALSSNTLAATPIAGYTDTFIYNPGHRGDTQRLTAHTASGTNYSVTNATATGTTIATSFLIRAASAAAAAIGNGDSPGGCIGNGGLAGSTVGNGTPGAP